MPDLETIVGVPLAMGMSTYARVYNEGRRKEFLAKKFGEENLDKVKINKTKQDPTRKDIMIMELELENQRYILELQHQKSIWFADLFYDTRLYEPVKLIPQY